MFSFFRKTSIGLVLSGGGARGFFHIGVIKALQELNITISEISGTSIGALIGAIYAANPKVNLEEMVCELNFIKITQMIASHLDKSSVSKLEDQIKKLIPIQYFSEFKIPITFNAVDINNGREIVFRSGNIFPAIISSISIPGVLPPIEYQDTFLVDGGILNNVPIIHLNRSNRYIVSDISGPFKNIDKKPVASMFFTLPLLLCKKISVLMTLKPKKSLKEADLFLSL